MKEKDDSLVAGYWRTSQNHTRKLMPATITVWNARLPTTSAPGANTPGSPSATAASSRSGAETPSWYSRVFSAAARFSTDALTVSVVAAQNIAATIIIRSPIQARPAGRSRFSPNSTSTPAKASAMPSHWAARIDSFGSSQRAPRATKKGAVYRKITPRDAEVNCRP